MQKMARLSESWLASVQENMAEKDRNAMARGDPKRSLYFRSFIVRRRATYCSAYLEREK